MLHPFFLPKNPHYGGEWLIADLHIHSIYSGGSLSPAEILKCAHTQLLDVVAISDHDEIKGAQEGQAIAIRDNNLPVMVISREISAGDHFHFLIIGGQPQNWEKTSRTKLEESFLNHRNSGGVIIWAHPWTKPKSSWAAGFLKEIMDEGMVDAAELFNAAILELNPEVTREVRIIWEEWVEPYQLGVVGGSDFHYLRQGRVIGTGRTYLKTIHPGVEGVIDALRGRRTVAGIFCSHVVDLDWLGKGNGIIFGAEPWYGEFRQFISEIHYRLSSSWLKPKLRRYLLRLFESGNYQMVWEILN